MYDLALNVDSWDLVFHNNDLLLIDNAERIGQQIKITLQFWFQEWFLDTTKGIPYLEYICIKNPNLQHIRQIFRNAIQSVPDVDSVTELTLSVNAKERIGRTFNKEGVAWIWLTNMVCRQKGSNRNAWLTLYNQ